MTKPITQAESTVALAVVQPQAVEPALRFRRSRYNLRNFITTIVLAEVALMASAALPWGGGMLGLGVSGVAGLGAAALAWRFRPKRGGWALDRILARTGSSATEQEAALTELLRRGRLSAQVRVEALGHLALFALERGDVSAAAALLAETDADAHHTERERYFTRGFWGECMRSILTWLVPEAMARTTARRPVATAAALRPVAEFWWQTHHPMLERYTALLTLLEALEATADPELNRSIHAWQVCRASALPRLAPNLYLLALARIGQRVPEALAELHRTLSDDRGGSKRGFLARVDPRYAVLALDEDPYRAELVPETTTALQVVDPSAATLALVSTRVPDLWFNRLRPVPLGLLGLAGLLTGFSEALSRAGWGMGYEAIVGSLAALSCGFTLAYAKLRIRPLLRLDRPLPWVWQREFAQTQSSAMRLVGAGSHSGGVASNLSALTPHQLSVFVAVARAEQFLDEGNAGGAWAEIAWLAPALDQGHLEGTLMRPVGSSLVRVAVFAGELGFARRIADGLQPQPRWTEGRWTRTCYGDAPRSVAWARALVCAAENDPVRTAAQIRIAHAAHAVFTPRRDEALYALVARWAEGRGAEVPKATTQVRTPDRSEALAWLRRTSPSLHERLSGGGREAGPALALRVGSGEGR